MTILNNEERKRLEDERRRTEEHVMILKMSNLCDRGLHNLGQGIVATMLEMGPAQLHENWNSQQLNGFNQFLQLVQDHLNWHERASEHYREWQTDHPNED